MGKKRILGIKVGKDFMKIAAPVIAVASGGLLAPAVAAAVGTTAAIVATPAISCAIATAACGGHSSDIGKSLTQGAIGGIVGSGPLGAVVQAAMQGENVEKAL